MINLRYHIVSLVAVFLALAIGITMGSTVISKGLVADLRNRVSRAETGIKNTNHDNSVLRGELGSLQGTDALAMQKLVPGLVAGKLAAVPIVVIATPDVDQKYRQQVVTTLQAAGATVQGTLTFDRRLSTLATDTGNVKKLADLLVTDPAAKPVTDPVKVWTDTADRLGAELAAATQPSVGAAGTSGPVTSTTQTSGSSTSTTVVSQPSFVAALRQAGFLSTSSLVDGVDDNHVLVGSGFRLVVLGEPATVPANPPVGFDVQFMVPLLENIAKTASTPPVVGAVADPGPTKSESPDAVRDWFVGPIRTDKALDGHVSTVNDLELAVGQVALVLAVQEVGTGKSGHYGIGSGVSALAPGTS